MNSSLCMERERDGVRGEKRRGQDRDQDETETKYITRPIVTTACKNLNSGLMSLKVFLALIKLLVLLVL